MAIFYSGSQDGLDIIGFGGVEAVQMQDFVLKLPAFVVMDEMDEILTPCVLFIYTCLFVP